MHHRESADRRRAERRPQLGVDISRSRRSQDVAAIHGFHHAREARRPVAREIEAIARLVVDSPDPDAASRGRRAGVVAEKGRGVREVVPRTQGGAEVGGDPFL